MIVAITSSLKLLIYRSLGQFAGDGFKFMDVLGFKGSMNNHPLPDDKVLAFELTHKIRLYGGDNCRQGGDPPIKQKALCLRSRTPLSEGRYPMEKVDLVGADTCLP